MANCRGGMFSVLTPLKGHFNKIFCFWFFHESVSPQSQSIPLGTFQKFSKIRGDICKSGCTTGITPVANLPLMPTTPGANFATSFASVVDTGGKFATAVNITSGNFAAGVNDISGK
jgi:hypothetical protein